MDHASLAWTSLLSKENRRHVRIGGTLSITIRRLSYALGAEMTGADISGSLNEETLRQIKDTLAEYHVLLFRGHSIGRTQHIEFARHFGETLFHPPEHLRDRAETDPDVSAVVSMVIHEPTAGPQAVGGSWHSDLDEFPSPAAISLLRCVKLPDVGGNTMFANMHRAYDELSTGMKALLGDLYGVYFRGQPEFDLSTPERYRESRLSYAAAAQPVVRTHPESGRKALFVSSRTKHFVAMTGDESRPLIDYLVDRATRPENVYRHQWQEGDLVIWDNRSVVHYAVPDYDPDTYRHMERVTTMGDVSGYRYLGPIGRWPGAEQPIAV